MSVSGALSSVPMFARLSEKQLERIVARAPVRTMADGTMVALRGQPAEHLIVLESGGLLAEYDDPGGRRLRLGHFRGPCAVDKVAVLDAGGHTATWRAHDSARLRFVHRSDILALLDDVPAVRRHVLTELARQVRHHQEQWISASLDDAVSRVATWLVRFAADHGPRVDLPGGQQGLAEELGLTRVTANRALMQLAQARLIRVGRGRVVLLAPELLAHRAARGAVSQLP